jgi:hypothetical protein
MTEERRDRWKKELEILLDKLQKDDKAKQNFPEVIVAVNER